MLSADDSSFSDTSCRFLSLTFRRVSSAISLKTILSLSEHELTLRSAQTGECLLHQLLLLVLVEGKIPYQHHRVIAVFRFDNSLCWGLSPLDSMSRICATFYLDRYRSFDHGPAFIIAQYPMNYRQWQILLHIFSVYYNNVVVVRKDLRFESSQVCTDHRQWRNDYCSKVQRSASISTQHILYASVTQVK